MKPIDKNPLFPVFFRLDRLKVLVVGAGEVGWEKMHFLLKSSPNAHIAVVAPWAKEDAKEIIFDSRYDIQWKEKEFETEDVLEADLIIAATNDHEVNLLIHAAAKQAGKLINVADTPALCDFYLGSIVTKGDLKIAISTNGKSPTLAKRIRQFFESTFPDDTALLLKNLRTYRDQLKGDFEHKVRTLNKLTETFIQ